MTKPAKPMTPFQRCAAIADDEQQRATKEAHDARRRGEKERALAWDARATAAEEIAEEIRKAERDHHLETAREITSTAGAANGR